MSRLHAGCWRITRRRLSITQPIVCIQVFAFMVVLNVDLSAVQADVRPDPVDRKVEHIGADKALKSYVEEASRRFLIPSSWIWAVMKVESAGDVRALSNKGAMGLMQIMPRTWEMLRQQHVLGADPYNPRDNILAGVAYLRELYDRYGESGIFAAYNAGPGRYEAHLSGRRSLPAETAEYVLKVSRKVGFPSLGSLSQSEKNTLDFDASSLFPAPKNDLQRVAPINENQIAEHSVVDQHVVDLSALTPTSTGIFVRTSRR